MAPGEFPTLLGPCGSGKATILMCTAAFVAPSAGAILLDARVAGWPDLGAGFTLTVQAHDLGALRVPDGSLLRAAAMLLS